MSSVTSTPRFSLSASMLVSASVGAVLGQIGVSWLTLFGTSPLSLTVLMLSMTCGALSADWFRMMIPLQFTHRSRFNVSGMAAGLVLLAASWTTPEILSATLLAGSETFGASASFLTILTLAVPGLFIALVSATAVLFFGLLTFSRSGTDANSVLAGGLGLLVLLVHCFAVTSLAVTTSAMLILAFVYCHLTRPVASRIYDSARERSPEPDVVSGFWISFSAAGLLAVGLMQMLQHIISLSVPVICLASAMASLSLIILTHPLSLRLLKPQGMTACSLLVLVIFPISFTAVAEFNLWLNTNGSSPFLILLTRSLQCCCLSVAALLPALLTLDRGRLRSGGRLELVSLILGATVGMMAMGLRLSPLSVLCAGLMMHAAAVAVRARMSGTGRTRSFFIGSRQVAFRPVELLLLLPVLVLFATFDPVQTSSVLFSERTAVALERGVDRELIPQSDVSRLVFTNSGLTGELSVWRRSGNVYEFQKNGLSLGKVSADTSLSPQPAEEILPAIMGLVNHARPDRVLVLGDDVGACLRTCCHFPIPEIVAVRSESRLTHLARRFTWSIQDVPADEDPRVTILHSPEIVALNDRRLKVFDVVIAASDSAASTGGSSGFTREYYRAIHARLTSEGVFCQRLRQQGLGPQPVKAAMATLSDVFDHVGVVQTIPGEILLIATDASTGLINPQILTHLQRDHVQREIATTGWDWSQIAVLPLVDAGDPIGIFSHEKMPPSISVSNGGFLMTLPLETARIASRSDETRKAFGSHQMQLITTVPPGEDHAEVQRRLTALAQQREILAGMPDQPWTYRKSLRMEMQRSPRPPIEVVENGAVVRTAHPLDVFSREYFQTLGSALTAVAESRPAEMLIQSLERFTQNAEPLLSHFARYEIVRLHEMTNHPSPADEFRHRLNIVFYTSPSDASVRPVIAAMEQLVSRPELVPDDAERYDILNSLVQKLIERWEARTAWEPRSALRVQNDVDQSVRITNLALDLMHASAPAAGVKETSFLHRRRYINAALIAPLRDYRDQVLAHRMKTETPPEADSEDPDDLPLLIKSDDSLNTN